MKNEYEIYKEATDKTDKIFSPSFCFAKWYHANIYFQTGETHSCYHPAPHNIDIEQIKIQPSALHNTKEKIEERKQMLQGDRPKGCQYCWNIEDLDKKLISDRQIRSGSLYREDRIEKIQKSPADVHINPQYIEISFSNLCNFKCGYCHPKASSRFYNEIRAFGPYVQSKNHRCDINWFKIYEEQNNPFIEAWWKWWPELSKDLKILRITGGEPLIQKSTFKMFDFLNDFPNPQLELDVNSNLGSKEHIIENFCDRINQLITHNKIQKFKLFSSIDTWGSQAEYIRTGLNLNLFEKNLKKYLTLTSSPLTFMITFNIFSVVSFDQLLKKLLEWRAEFNQPNSNYQDYHRIRFDISYLKEPLQYDINILPKEEFLKYMDNHLNFMNENVDDNSKSKFSFMEYQRFLRVYEYMKNTLYSEEKIAEGRSDFYNFFSEFDRRRNTNLIQEFPQLQNFWNECEKVANV